MGDTEKKGEIDPGLFFLRCMIESSPWFVVFKLVLFFLSFKTNLA